MERGLNLRDPRLQRYLESLEPKYRKMLKALYGKQKPDIEELKRIVRNSTEASSDSGGGQHA